MIAPPIRIFCAVAHPLDPAVLCSRLDGHTGLHVAGDGDDWTDEEELQ